jgi:hypothetical protein
MYFTWSPLGSMRTTPVSRPLLASRPIEEERPVGSVKIGALASEYGHPHQDLNPKACSGMKSILL